MKIESRRLRCAEKTQEVERDDAKQKREGKKNEVWSEANGEMRQRGRK